MAGTLLENIPEELKKLPRWVCANKDSKRPMICTEGKAASVNKPDTWSSFADAQDALDKGLYEYAGFVFDADGFVGIDIDVGFDDGLPTDDALAAINACASYTEVSKSGKGFHIICKGDIPFKGKNNRKGWEIYKLGRYFVLTGRTIGYKTIRDAQDGIDEVLLQHFQDRPSTGSTDAQKRKIWQPTCHADGKKVGISWEKISQGSRHLSLVSYCGFIHNSGASRETLYQMALNRNKNSLVPPLEIEEVKQIVNSVARYRR